VLPADYLEAGHVTHAYAMTVHKAQGLTCDRSFTLGTDELYRELGYVAMSRGRASNQLYVVGPLPIEPDSQPHAPSRERNADDVLSGLSTSRAKALAVDRIEGTPILTQSTTELVAERQCLRDLLAAAPADRSYDIDSLISAQRSMADQPTDLQRRHTDLDSHHRTWRERRRGPDPQLVLVEAKQAEVMMRLARIEPELATARSCNRKRQDFLEGHESDAHRLQCINQVLADRVDRVVRRAINDPPMYLSAVGAVPADGSSVAGWVEAAAIIETYRQEHDITDKHHALGREPPDPVERSAWHEAIWAIEEFVAPPERVVDVEDPDLGISIEL
jgi:hypothetical protein